MDGEDEKGGGRAGVGEPHPRPLPQAGGEERGSLPQAGGEERGPLSQAGGEDAGAARVHPNKHREMQVARTGRRKLFNKERKAAFLDWFAATANMSWAAEVAGVSYKTVSKHVLKDPEFAAELEAAMQVGVLRAKAKLVETPRREVEVDEDGEIDAPPPEMSVEQAERALREHGRTLHYGRKPGRTPRIAGNAEVLKAVAKRLAALAARVRRRGGPGDSFRAGAGEAKDDG